MNKIIKRLVLLDLFFLLHLYALQITANLVRAILVKASKHSESEKKRYTFVVIPLDQNKYFAVDSVRVHG